MNRTELALKLFNPSEDGISRWVCKDECVKYGKCRYCLCDLPGKFYVTESCNKGERFPDLMDEESWMKYKEENNIK